jgi:hypothetical protein
MPMTLMLAFDHQPYRYNACGMPAAMEAAVHLGFAQHLTDFDCRQIEWEDESAERSHSDARRIVVDRPGSAI